MSWFARSIANSLKLDDDVYEEDHSTINNTTNSVNQESKLDQNQNQNQSTSGTPRGVKEDLTELTKSFSRQIWGVTSFLAPPPIPQEQQPQMRDQVQSPSEESGPELSEEAVIERIKSDFAEISGKFKSGISKWSNNISVSEITKMASSFLQIGTETDPTKAVGITEEVLLFARNISMHPGTWTDFPVHEVDDFDNFDMSDAQQEHALAVERLAPTLAALKMELCPEYMSECCFWKIYFVLLQPKLNMHDAKLLSTPQILEARAKLAHELQNRVQSNPEPLNSEVAAIDSNKTDESGASYLGETADLSENYLGETADLSEKESVPCNTSAADADPSVIAIDFETEKHPLQSSEMQFIDKSVIKDLAEHQHPFSGSSVGVEEKFEDDDGYDWLKEESSETVGISGSTIHLANDGDVSFSDFEEEDGDELLIAEDYALRKITPVNKPKNEE